MRFGKKLALAMIRDAGEAPYLSQKELKHQLVGLEKLCKAYREQADMLAQGLDRHVILHFAEEQRTSCHVPQREGPLQVNEIVCKDGEFFDILVTDVWKIRQYVDDCEAELMEATNEWLESASAIGAIVPHDTTVHSKNPEKLAEFVLGTSAMVELPDDLSPESLIAELTRIRQYSEVNLSAIRKLVQRRCKNVPEFFWSRDDFPDMSNVMTPEGPLLEETIIQIAKLFKSDLVSVNL
jgi:hypothetical protein